MPTVQHPAISKICYALQSCRQSLAAFWRRYMWLQLLSLLDGVSNTGSDATYGLWLYNAGHHLHHLQCPLLTAALAKSWSQAEWASAPQRSNCRCVPPSVSPCGVSYWHRRLWSVEAPPGEEESMAQSKSAHSPKPSEARSSAVTAWMGDCCTCPEISLESNSVQSLQKSLKWDHKPEVLLVYTYPFKKNYSHMYALKLQ